MTRPVPPLDHVDIYPVGALRAIHVAWRSMVRAQWPTGRPVPHRIRLRHAWYGLRRVFRSVVRHVRQRKWHELKCTFNGYLAEPYHWPTDGSLRRCGSSWTKRRAMRSLRRHGWTRS